MIQAKEPSETHGIRTGAYRVEDVQGSKEGGNQEHTVSIFEFRSNITKAKYGKTLVKDNVPAKSGGAKQH